MDALTWILALFTFAACIIVGRLLILQRKRSNKTKLCHHIFGAPEAFDSSAEVVIVGSGVLGSAFGAVLAHDGRKVTIIERDISEPDRIVGELLQPGGYRALNKLGLKEASEGIDAHIVHGYVIHDVATSSTISLSYPLGEDNNVLTGRSFHHGRFIMGLRKEAIKNGASLVEGTVSSLLEDENNNVVGVSYKDKSTGEIKTLKADLTVVADGCFSKFRKDLTETPVSVTSHFSGLIMHGCPQYKHGHAEIVLSDKGPILVYQISSTCTRILVDIQGKMPSDVVEYMRKNVMPQLPNYMQGPFDNSLKGGRIRSMPNSFLPPTAKPKPGVILLGDAFNMRHPLTGAGMSVALNDAVIWRDLLSSVPNLKDHHKILECLKTFQWKRKGSHSFVVNVLAQALYSLFSASDESLYDLRQACFEYFKLGGMAVSGPVGLLSILKPNPVILVGHFFAIAFYAVYRTLKTCRFWALHVGFFRVTMILSKACQVIFPLIGSELKSIMP